jgi:murein L,D-transpeptidase YafK
MFKEGGSWGVDPGGLVEIHGLGRRFGWLGALHRKTDWTDGCVAVTNEEIDEIWKLVPLGTPVEIRP